jgi:CubicO group peptidase (beta-lactamase class C family)
MQEKHVIPGAGGYYGVSQLAGYGHGFGVKTMIDTTIAGFNGFIGEWAWDGKLSVWYSVNPEEDMVAVFLIQRFPGDHDDLPKRFAQPIYEAIDD